MNINLSTLLVIEFNIFLLAKSPLAISSTLVLWTVDKAPLGRGVRVGNKLMCFQTAHSLVVAVISH
ncbi:hypothetical protein [Nostoc sp. FACHB-110]|uniref:hypothetical protein n=1 Tax=Nostoc sp. FACHB-110 TaxID=2692834 RepID=UPI001684DCFF|nr:hypothetical protein [Nostoc sp. FACHB-110]MBD2435948.1 hypothetical protein [Nostoc sp. FACHB-110]